LYMSTVQGQVYCILTKHTVADQMLKLGGGHIFLGGFTATTKIRLIRIFGDGGLDV